MVMAPPELRVLPKRGDAPELCTGDLFDIFHPASDSDSGMGHSQIDCKLRKHQ